MASLRCLIVCFAILVGAITLPGPKAAQTGAAASGQDASVLMVSTRVLRPFVFHEDKALTGFSIELWRAIAREMDRKSEFVEVKTLPELLDSVKFRKVDMAISAISITAQRERQFDFSQPMFDSGLQILISSDRKRSAGWARTLKVYWDNGLFHLLGLMLLLMVIPAPIVWLIERRHHRNLFKSDRKHGEFFNSLWWSSTTLAGQATDMPYSPIARVLALVWMLIGILFISFFTASVTSALTVNKLEQSIKGPEDLAGKKVASVKGSTAAGFLKDRNIDTQEFDNIDAAYEPLMQGKVDAVVYDAPILLYFASHGGKGKVETAGPVFRPEAYGILFPTGSPLRKPVNAALLRLKESGEYRSLYLKYFSTRAQN